MIQMSKGCSLCAVWSMLGAGPGCLVLLLSNDSKLRRACAWTLMSERGVEKKWRPHKAFRKRDNGKNLNGAATSALSLVSRFTCVICSGVYEEGCFPCTVFSPFQPVRPFPMATLRTTICSFSSKPPAGEKCSESMMLRGPSARDVCGFACAQTPCRCQGVCSRGAVVPDSYFDEFHFCPVATQHLWDSSSSL